MQKRTQNIKVDLKMDVSNRNKHFTMSGPSKKMPEETTTLNNSDSNFRFSHNYEVINCNHLLQESLPDNQRLPLYGKENDHLNLYQQSKNVTEICTNSIQSDEYGVLVYWVGIIVPFLFGIIAMVGLIGNLMVIVSVLLNRQMRHSTNLLIIHLALADLLFIVFCVPFTAVSYAIPIWPFGHIWCKIYQYMILVTAFTSVYTLVLMSLDRFLAVCYPIQSLKIRTPRNTLIAVLTLTGILVVSMISLLDNFAPLKFTNTSSRCVDVRAYHDPGYGKFFYTCFFVLGYALPLGLICLLYGLMLRRLLHGGIKRSISRQKSKNDSKKRVTRLVIVVVSMFALCWLPVHSAFLVQFWGRSAEKDDEGDEEILLIAFKIGAQCLAYLNSCINPVLYAFLSEQYRLSFKKLVSHCWPTAPPKTTIKFPAAVEEDQVLVVNGNRLHSKEPLNYLSEKNKFEDRTEKKEKNLCVYQKEIVVAIASAIVDHEDDIVEAKEIHVMLKKAAQQM